MENGYVDNGNSRQGKKSNIASIIIIILLLIVIGIGSFIAYMLVSDKNDNNSNNSNSAVNVDNSDQTEEKNQIVKINSDEQEKLIKKINDYNFDFIDKYSSNGLKGIDNNLILYFLFEKLEGFGDGFNKSGFTTEDLKKVANKYILDDIDINYTNIVIPGTTSVLYRLSSDGKYENTNINVGGPGYYVMKEYYTDGYYDKVKDEYTVNTKIIYRQFCGDVCMIDGDYYSDYTLKNKVYDIFQEGEGINDSMIDFDYVYQNVKEKLPITSYTFTKNKSGNYVLSKVIFN